MESLMHRGLCMWNIWCTGGYACGIFDTQGLCMLYLMYRGLCMWNIHRGVCMWNIHRVMHVEYLIHGGYACMLYLMHRGLCMWNIEYLMHRGLCMLQRVTMCCLVWERVSVAVGWSNFICELCLQNLGYRVWSVSEVTRRTWWLSEVRHCTGVCVWSTEHVSIRP